MNLCLIPARGGSKRILRKNIREFAGKPMIAWSIEAAKQSGCFDNIVVSTDDREIRDIAKSYGADVPFLRPSYLSDDFTSAIKVVTHAVMWHQNQGCILENVCCLYATAPFVDPTDIQKAKKLFDHVASNCFVFAATEYSAPIQRALKLDPVTGMPDVPAKYFNHRTQDLEPTFHDAGHFIGDVRNHG